MKLLTLQIENTRLFDEVSRLTSYLGAKQALGMGKEEKRDPGAHFDRIAVVDADKALLIRFASEAVSSLAERLKAMVTAMSVTDEKVNLSLQLSDSYDERLSRSVETNFASYLISAVTARWLTLCDSEKVGKWESESYRLLDEIMATIYHRNPPRKRSNK